VVFTQRWFATGFWNNIDGYFGTTLMLPVGCLVLVCLLIDNKTITGEYPIIHLPITGFSKLCRFTALVTGLTIAAQYLLYEKYNNST